MQKIDLWSSKRIITSCTYNESKKDSSIWFQLDYVQINFDENKKSESGKLIPQKEIKTLSISKKSLGLAYEKMDNEKICQELLGKSILITTSIGD